MFTVDKSVFVLVDVQGRLAEIMCERDALFDNLQRLIKGMQALEVPILWMEQLPQRLGPTTPQLASLLPSQKPISKSSFSGCGNEEFMKQLASLGRRQVIVAGIETHVCVYQTAADLVRGGYEVEVVADAVSSRTAANRAIGIEKIKACGAGITSVEMILFELTRTAEHPGFRELLKIVK